MRLARKLILATLAGMALVLAASAYFRITRELELFERDMIMDHAVLARTLANAIPRVWAEKGREEALSLLDNVSNLTDGFASVGSTAMSPRTSFSRERHYTTSPSGCATGCGLLELSESLAYEQAYVRDTLVRAAWATLAAVCGGPAGRSAGLLHGRAASGQAGAEGRSIRRLAIFLEPSISNSATRLAS